MIMYYELASAFREAIEKAICAGEIREMQTFPRGCCGFASDLLQRYLYERGIFTWYKHGLYKSESHVWLETEDGLVIDITGDQYKNKGMKFSEPVYVGNKMNGFHDKFSIDLSIPYQAQQDPYEAQKIDKRYQAVMKYLKL